MHLDALDLKILAELQANGRISNADLAERIGLSPSAALKRVRKLRNQGVITGYTVQLAAGAVNRMLTAYLEVTLTVQYPQEIEVFNQYIASLQEIVSADQVSGSYDYLLKVISQDMLALVKLTDALLGADVHVAKVLTIPVLINTKPDTGFPLKLLGGDQI